MKTSKENSQAIFLEKINFFSNKDIENIKTAIFLTEKTSGDKLRALGMADILLDLNLDAETITAAIILDSLEKNKITRPEIENAFGKTIASLACGTANISFLQTKNKTQHEAENIRKMFFAMIEDIRVIFIKLADRLYLLRTDSALSPEGRKQCAQECLDIFAPLADRLGISRIKEEIEDLSLKEINHEAYLQIKEIISEKKDERRVFLDSVKEKILNESKIAGIHIKIKSRAKHFYSIYQKMRKRNKNAEEIYDLFGVRIICESIENCYTLLGIVHKLWMPLEGRFKDYIARPKSNGYQSLHTTIITQDGRQIEIQIRTHEMNHIAENGIASHWLYKRGASRDLVKPLDISFINRLREWKEKDSFPLLSSPDFLNELKKEILKDSIFVFTPQGKVVELPEGSTPIDFAYNIHSAIGDKCSAAKADGVIIPLSSKLKNTQTIEIITSASAHPHINWLRVVKTSKARSKIRSWLEISDESLSNEKTTQAKKKPPSEIPEAPAAAPLAENELKLQEVIPPQREYNSIFHVKVEDEKNMMVRFARCCKPITGDQIIGYVSRGRGIIIHRKDCRSITHIPDFEERKIETQWENSGSLLVKRFKIEARYMANLFSEIEGAVRKNHGHLIEGRLNESSPSRLSGFFTVQLEDSASLKNVIKNIRGIPAILSVQSLN
ncbi:MAG: RelA/SpoT family protein [Treponema sp.]|jgi:GTP pyrophosphokinase|nr:RelA/SpoT family protein [Treponema sp.]